jgi:hypothetical protein
MIFTLKLFTSDISDLGQTYPVQIGYIRPVTVSTQKTVVSSDSSLTLFLFVIHLFPHFRTMSDSPKSHCVIEKRTKKSQDVGGSSSKAKKPRVRKIILRPPPPVPSDEEEEELPLQIHSPIEHLGSRRTPVNYMRENSRTIITQRNTPCYDSDKVGPDPRFWSYFRADWYRSIYESKQTPVVPMQ